MSDLDHLFRVACCGLSAAIALFDEHDIPLPARAEVIHHDFDDYCCDTLLVRPTTSRNLSIESNDCGVIRKAVTFEVYLGRCVDLRSDNSDCGRPYVPCGDAIDCAGDEPTPRPSACDPAPSKAHESLWLMRDRWLVEHHLAEAWRECLCSDPCDDSPCGGVPCSTLQWVSTTPHDSGGCAGIVAEFEWRYPT